MRKREHIVQHGHTGLDDGGKLDATNVRGLPPLTQIGSTGPAGTTSFDTPAIVLGTAAAAGSASTAIRSDSTIVAFDATAPTTQAFGDSAAGGSAAVAAKRDHKHAMPTAAVTTSGLTQATARLLGRTTASTGAIEEITVGTGLSLSAGALTATGGSAAITVQDEGTPLSTAADTLNFVGAGVVATGSGTTKTITIAGAGASGFPLDGYTLDGTYGDHFTGSSLSGIWTRRNFTSGAETYQVAPGSTYIRIDMASRAVGDAYFQTAPGGDFTIAMKIVARFQGSQRQPIGLWIVNSSGTGMATIFYSTPVGFLLTGVTTYTSYSGSFQQTPSWTLNSFGSLAIEQQLWQKIRKSGTNYFGSFSNDGELWSPETPAFSSAITVDRIGFGINPLGTVGTGAVFDVDWFNKL